MAAAAIMLALAGLQLGKAFFSDPAQVASNDAAPIVAAQPVQTASLDTTSRRRRTRSRQPRTARRPARQAGRAVA